MLRSSAIIQGIVSEVIFSQLWNFLISDYLRVEFLICILFASSI